MILSQGNCIPFICRSDNNFISWGCTLSCPPSLKESISRLSPLPNVFFVPRDSLPKSLFEIYINVIECVWPSGDRRAVNTFCLPLTLAAILKPKTWVRLCNKACSSWEGGCEGGWNLHFLNYDCKFAWKPIGRAAPFRRFWWVSARVPFVVGLTYQW